VDSAIDCVGFEAHGHGKAHGEASYCVELMMAILSGRAQIAKAVNATLISLNDTPQVYQDFDRGVSRKFFIDPHGLVK
jgi:3-phenylpropionate/trans-cinnamate dioxygenase ferredoxin subunit